MAERSSDPLAGRVTSLAGFFDKARHPSGDRVGGDVALFMLHVRTPQVEIYNVCCLRLD